MLLAAKPKSSTKLTRRRSCNRCNPWGKAALAETTRFKNPGIIPEPIAAVAADELLLVDAHDDSGEWLRVVSDGAVSWIERKDVARLKAMETLPVIGVSASFPFRALSLATSTDFPPCDQAEAMIAIQTPADMSLSFTINGVDLHIGSPGYFSAGASQCAQHDRAPRRSDTIFGGIVQQGESVIGILGRTADGSPQVLDWSGALPASEAEIARGQRAQDALNSLARVNGWGEHKTYKHPPEHVHVVERGDSLYSIARLYETSVADIILANLGDEPIKLYRGTELVIPNPGSGFAGHGAIPLDATRES